MRSHRHVALSLALASTVALSACGGVSEEDYRSDAEGICADVVADLKPIEAKIAQNPTDLTVFDAAIERTTKALGDLEDVEAPDDRKDAYDAYIAAQRAAVGQIEKLRDAIKANDAAAIQKIASAQQAAEVKTDKTADAAGIPGCKGDD